MAAILIIVIDHQEEIISGRGYFAGLRVTKRNKATVLLTLTLFQTPTLTPNPNPYPNLRDHSLFMTGGGLAKKGGGS